MESIQFANLTFRGLHRETILQEAGSLQLIVTVNAEIIVEANRNPQLADVINANIATLDGQWPYVFARIRSGRKDIEKISGSDLSYELCELASTRGHRVFLLGACPEVNAEAQRRLYSRFEVAIRGYAPAEHKFPFPSELDSEILHRIADWRPAVLLVAFGAPKQELWMAQHRQELEELGVRWCLGAGGSFEFIAGTIPRAPEFLQRAGLESLWRLVFQPRLRFLRILRAFRFLQYA